jgi:5-methylcytosine-specific restriction protein A
MTRSLPEWIADKPNQSIPPRVRVRIFDKCKGRCAQCTRVIRGGQWQADHVVALINGGEHREHNLQCLCTDCHKTKTAGDVAVKSKIARVRAKHLGIKNRNSRPIPGSKASGWKRTFSNGWVRREA